MSSSDLTRRDIWYWCWAAGALPVWFWWGMPAFGPPDAWEIVLYAGLIATGSVASVCLIRRRAASRPFSIMLVVAYAAILGAYFWAGVSEWSWICYAWNRYFATGAF